MNTEKRNTKESYLLEALRLFAQKGYEAVGVVELAQAVGCTTSALYKHYAGKKALFEAIIERCKMGFKENMTRLHTDFSDRSAQEILSMTEEEQIQTVTGLFLAIADSEYPKLFRKLVMVEQFKHPELAQVYNEHYINSQFESFRVFMKVMIDGGVYRDGNARVMAVQYISPVVLMIGMCDREPERKEEALALLREHVKQFNKAYRT